MKRIGYIYKYNPSEGMGILVFGTWKTESGWGWKSSIKNTPILFSANDLLSDVCTGQLVYFDLEGHSASNIEHASLSNFKVDYINSIIRCGEHESEYCFYSDNTYISFECLDNIIIPNRDFHKLEKTANNDAVSSSDDLLDDWIDDDYEEEDDDDDDYLEPLFDLYPIGISTIDTNEMRADLPESVTELFTYFGKYAHRYGKESKSLNVFDLSLWVDSNVLDTEYYGKKVDELLFLYDVFVLKKHFDKKGNEINFKREDDCISYTWSLLLSKFGESDLKDIIDKAPLLQPALPINFCKKNIGLLSEHYGMPNVEICKLYCLHKILKAENISDYNDIKHNLYNYRHCNVAHIDGEGVPMCQMGTRRINNLEKELESQYENIIKPRIIAQLKVLSDNPNVFDNICNSSSEEFNNIGLFVEKYNNLKNNFLQYGVCEELTESYENLPQLYKDVLRSAIIDGANMSVISAVNTEELSPYWLSRHIQDLGDWILESTKQKVKELVNERFSKLENLEDLGDAYKADYITSIQYYYRYKQITNSFDTCQFFEEISNYRWYDSPMMIQWYVVSRIIDQFAFQSIDEYKYDNYVNSICNIRSLLKWFSDHGRLKDVVLKKAEEKICSVLTNKERWKLFEEKYVQSPGVENIRKHLDKLYNRRIQNDELLKLVCFQDIMLSDANTTKDINLKLFIADILDERHLCLLRQKASGLFKLYLWQKDPSDTYDWDLIKSHFHELKANAQIRVLRYLFAKMSSGELLLSLDDLYSVFVETTTPACSAVRGILYILKAKKDNINATITPSMLESVIGDEQNQQANFLRDSAELFYPCSGYLAISATKQEIEYQSFYGVLTKEVKNGDVYYVIRFYNSPVNIIGRVIEWLDSEFTEIAEHVLLRNIDTDLINGKYYIHESYEFFVKQFVVAYKIDDKCGLVSDKESMIEQGYLPRNNVYQPLYTNYLRRYEESGYGICRGGCIGGSDPNNGIPYFWCNKKMCVRRAHFLLPSTLWDKYHFADLLYITLGQSADLRESIWRVNAEISQFICDYWRVYDTNDRNISSKPLNELEEIGTWDDTSSVYRNIYDNVDDDEYEEDDDSNEEYPHDDYDNDEPTYGKYSGSYAQDVMGYSDDDIDTIFDGDPNAYWNID